MIGYTDKDIKLALKKLKIQNGSTILFHSSLANLGPINNKKISEIPSVIFNVLSNILGKKGTLIVPAFFYNYSRKNTPFDLYKSPPCNSLGNFPNYLFKNIRFKRTKHPLTSLMVFGNKAYEYCDLTNFQDYGYGSAWEKIYSNNVDIVFFGVKPSKAMTFIHFIEFVFGVPHMYTKNFNTPIYQNSKLISKSLTAYVRYRDFNIEVDQKRFEKNLLKNKIIKSTKLGSGYIYTGKAQDIFQNGISKLYKNNYYFLKSKPNFKKNLVPLI